MDLTDVNRLSPLPWLYNKPNQENNINLLKEIEESIDLSNQDIISKNKSNSSLKHRPIRRPIYGVTSKKMPNHIGNNSKPKLKVRYQNELIGETELNQNELYDEKDWFTMNHKSSSSSNRQHLNNRNHHLHHHYHHHRKNPYKQQQQHHQQQHQKRIWNSLRFKAKEIGKIIPSVRDINIIDKYSRLLFPFLFLIFNICYWCFYFFQSSNYINSNNLN